jgi:hypothetical protein
MTSPPVLQPFNPHFRTFVETDAASNNAVGGVCYQLDDQGHKRIIAYESHKLNKLERGKPSRHIELLGLVFLCRRWRPYLDGIPFTIRTDHESLRWLNVQKADGSLASATFLRLQEELSRFDYTIEYIRGSDNIMADALSRPPVSVPEGPIIDTNEHPLNSLSSVPASSPPTPTDGTALEWPLLMQHLLQFDKFPPCSPAIALLLRQQRPFFYLPQGYLVPSLSFWHPSLCTL